MDENRFDDLSRRLVETFTRRATVKGAASGLLAVFGLRQATGTAAQVSQATCGNKICARNPAICTDGCVCCTYANGNSRCRPPDSCGSGTILCPTGLVYNPELQRCAQCADDADCLEQGQGLIDCREGICFSTCFTAGTRIAMADGTSRPIETIRAGDAVLGREGRINRVTYVDMPPLGTRLLYGLNGSQPFVTSEHPFFTEDGWKAIDPAATARENPNIPVKRLKIGDRLLALAAVRIPTMAGGLADAAEIRLEPVLLQSLIGVPADPATQLYNLLLDGDHAYFANDYLVHNRG